MRAALIVAALALAVTTAARAEEPELRPGPGRDQVMDNCGACHTLSYIPMNSPFLNEAQWTAEVNKMVATFHAPIAREDIPAIIAYLTAQYGAR